jgi:phospholipase/carboxylesterase
VVVASAADELLHRVRPANGEPAGALVLLHGRGADENDLYPLLDMLDPERRLLGVCPRAPLSLPPGGAHWYVVRSVGYPNPETFWPTYERLQVFYDGFLEDNGIPSDRVVLGGFSQGTVMSYALGLGKGRPRPRALLAFSGFIPTVDGLDIDLDGLDGYPVAIGHGTHDPVIEVRWGRDAKERLEAAGADVRYRESPMAHTIDPGWVGELVPWIAELMPR